MIEMGLYGNTGGAAGESVENLHPKDDRDDRDSTATGYSGQERGKILVCITFFLEMLILAAVIVLEYFLRWTTVFPIRKVNFLCSDPDLAFKEKDASYSLNALSDSAIFSLAFCVPPFIIILGEIGVWAFSDEEQKSIRACCRPIKIPQVVRRLLRFIATFAFGAFTLMIFVDVMKLMTGKLRPNFLEVCNVNQTLCTANQGFGGDELCQLKDELKLRDARMAFPSLRAALTAYSALFIAVYIHGALRTRSVRVLRPFLSMAFTMLALLCGLTEIGLNHNYWTDVIVGFAMGGILAIYLGVVVLYNFREYVSERKMIRLLHGFLVDHQLLNEITRDGKMRLFPFPFHIPRAHAVARDRPYQKFEGIKSHNPPLPIYNDLDTGADHYRGRHPQGTGHIEEHSLSHL